jgi:hypothetical protein
MWSASTAIRPVPAGPITPPAAGTDALVQGTGYDGSATTQFANLPVNGSGFVASLEAAIRTRSRDSGRASCWSRRARSSGRRSPSRAPMTAWVRSASVPPQRPPAGWVCVDGYQRQQNGVAALRAGHRLARLGRRGEHDVRRRSGAADRAGDAAGVRRRRHRQARHALERPI